MKGKAEPKIFVAEDNLLYQQLIAKALEPISTDIHFFTTGEQCIEALHLQPEVIVLDYQLDGAINGLETLHEIRKSNAQVCVILFSSQRAIHTSENQMRFGSFLFLEKKLQTFQNLRRLVHQGYKPAVA